MGGGRALLGTGIKHIRIHIEIKHTGKHRIHLHIHIHIHIHAHIYRSGGKGREQAAQRGPEGQD
jgi:hypothetical protein